MKLGFFGFIMIALMIVTTPYVRAQDGDNASQNAAPTNAAPGRKVPADPINHQKGMDILQEIQGGNKDVFILVFAVNDAVGASTLNDINTQVVNPDHKWIRTTTVDLKKASQYNDLLKVLKIEGEPKKGHSEPIVVVISQGEGFVLFGPEIVDGVIKRLQKVEDKQLFATPGK